MRLSATRSVITAALAVLAPAASAADTIRSAPLHRGSVSGEQYDINDLRLTAGFLPENNKADGHGANWSHDYRLALTAMRAGKPLEDMGGLIYGGEFAIDNAGKNSPTGDFSVIRFMVDGMVGWGYRLGNIPNLHFEGTPFLGIGLERYHSEFGGNPTTLGYEYGVRAAGYYTFDNLWQVGLDLRYISNQSEPEFGGSVGSISMDTSGLAFLFVGGKRF
jgi:hypothetical protein